MPTLHRSMPIVAVTDVVASASFYHEKLGIDQGSFYGDPPAFCIVGRDTVTLALERVESPNEVPPKPYWAAYVYVDDVEALHAEFVGKGVDVVRGPETMDHGCREIDVRDPDGNIVCFGQGLYPTEAGPGL